MVSEQPDAWEVAIKLLAMRAYSTQELRQRLARRGYAVEQIQAAVSRLTQSGYLDDAAYARTWGRSQANRRSLGPARLARELKARGISDAEISGTVADVFAERDPRAVAEDATVRKLRMFHGLAPAIARRRLAGYLTRQGFATEIILALCRKYFPSFEDPDEQV